MMPISKERTLWKITSCPSQGVTPVQALNLQAPASRLEPLSLAPKVFALEAATPPVIQHKST